MKFASHLSETEKAPQNVQLKYLNTNSTLVCGLVYYTKMKYIRYYFNIINPNLGTLPDNSTICMKFQIYIKHCRDLTVCPISKASWRVAFLIDNKISILGLWQRTETLYKKWC